MCEDIYHYKCLLFIFQCFTFQCNVKSDGVFRCRTLNNSKVSGKFTQIAAVAVIKLPSCWNDMKSHTQLLLLLRHECKLNLKSTFAPGGPQGHYRNTEKNTFERKLICTVFVKYLCTLKQYLVRRNCCFFAFTCYFKLYNITNSFEYSLGSLEPQSFGMAKPRGTRIFHNSDDYYVHERYL